MHLSNMEIGKISNIFPAGWSLNIENWIWQYSWWCLKNHWTNSNCLYSYKCIIHAESKYDNESFNFIFFSFFLSLTKFVMSSAMTPVWRELTAILNTLHVDFKSRRQIKFKKKKVSKFKISLPYLNSAWKMHSNVHKKSNIVLVH